MCEELVYLASSELWVKPRGLGRRVVWGAGADEYLTDSHSGKKEEKEKSIGSPPQPGLAARQGGGWETALSTELLGVAAGVPV